MSIQINISRAHLIWLSVLVLIIVFSMVAVAVWTPPTNGAWHPGNEVKVKIGEEFYSLQEAIEQNKIKTQCGGGGTGAGATG